MASHEEGEEARESDESMTTFEPYVAGKVRVSLSMVSYSRDGKQRGGQDLQQRRAAQQQVARARGQPNQKQNDSSESSAGGIGAVFRKIRSTLSTAAGLQQPSLPASTASRASLTASSASASGAATKRPATSPSSSGATKQSQQRQQHQRRPVNTVGAARNKQPRQQKQINSPPPPANTSSKKAPQLHQHSSAPSVLRQPGKGGRTRVRVSPSRSSRATSPPVRGGRQSSSPPIKEGSPLVIDEMASFGPGSGRRNRPPAARLPPAQLTNREQGLSVQSELQHQQRSKSEEPPSSPQWAEPEPPRALDDGFGRALSNTRQQQQQISSSGDVHQISLMSYSDVHKHRAAAAKIPPTATSGGGVGGGVGGVSSTVGGGRSVAPRPRGGVKKPLNKQDLLKRIGSIENDEVSKTTASVTVDQSRESS